MSAQIRPPADRNNLQTNNSQPKVNISVTSQVRPESCHFSHPERPHHKRFRRSTAGAPIKIAKVARVRSEGKTTTEGQQLLQPIGASRRPTKDRDA